MKTVNGAQVVFLEYKPWSGFGTDVTCPLKGTVRISSTLQRNFLWDRNGSVYGGGSLPDSARWPHRVAEAKKYDLVICDEVKALMGTI